MKCIEPASRLWSCVAVVGLTCAGAVAQAIERPRVEYSLEYRSSEAGSSLKVRLTGSGLDAAGEVGLYLPDWGDWVRVDSLYLRGFRSDPPARRDPESGERWIVEAPKDWDGSLEVSYTIPLIDLDSRAAAWHGLMPWEVRREGAPYAAATSRNTLMLVTADGEAVAPDCTVTLVAPPGYSVASGWGGVSAARQEVAADLTEDSPILFGESPRVARGSVGGVPCEVVQFSEGPDLTASLLAQAVSLAEGYARSTSLPLGRPLRIFVTDKGGGQRVDRGLWMQTASGGWEESPYYKHLMAHELFHEWLGGMAREADESTTWFQEGFTDYLSIWHMVAARHATPEWFAQRMGGLNAEARMSEAYGRVAFGDPSASWRDWDGPNETLAYKGGAVLAFALDVERRRAGAPRLGAMIGELARENGGVYTIASIRAWLESHGLSAFYDAYIAEPALPEWGELLAGAGFEIVERGAPLTYFGIRSGGDTFLGEILAIDPAGPAAALGLSAGDHVTGLWPSRDPRPRIGDEVVTEYRFGLDLASPEAAAINLGIRSGDKERTVKVTPTSIPGGSFEVVTPGDQTASFFAMPG